MLLTSLNMFAAMFQPIVYDTNANNSLFFSMMADTTPQTPTPRTDEQQQTSLQASDQRLRDKGKQIMVEPEDLDITNLRPEDFGKPLDLKVYRKWVSKNIPDPSPTGICFILLDKKVRK